MQQLTHSARAFNQRASGETYSSDTVQALQHAVSDGDVSFTSVRSNPGKSMFSFMLHVMLLASSFCSDPLGTHLPDGGASEVPTACGSHSTTVSYSVERAQSCGSNRTC